jgi:signal transduction histidine kinase
MAEAGAYTAAMPDSIKPLRARRWNGPFSPLSLAVYVTCLAIDLEPFLDWLHGRLAWSLSTVAGIAGLCAVPLLYVLRCLLAGEVRGDTAALQRARLLSLLQGPAALLACGGLMACCGPGSGGVVPVLLIIVAGQLGVLYPPRTAVVLMLVMNLALGALLVQRWGWGDLPALLAYIGFQIFAGLSTATLRNAEEARDAVLQINAELLATRRLLLESVRSEERLHLSRELHDAVGHKLTALKLQLRARKAADPTLAECERLADEVLTEVRGVVSALRQHDGIDLEQALTALVPALPHPQVRLELAPAARAAGLAQAQALLRCAQEGLTNALRHSGAAHVAIRLAADAQGIALSIEDDGRAQRAPAPGNGLRGMRERLEALGGKLEIGVAEGGGLRLRAWLPQAPLAVPA